jgi:ferrochelatase
MPRFLPEPAARSAGTDKTGVLLINLGTPAQPTAKALRPYLKQFLSDPRVVEIPRLLWWPILNGIILNTRPKKSAEKYATIWTRDGSPLLFHTQRQTKLLKGMLGERGYGDVTVEYAMRYGEPSVESAIDAMRKAGVERLLVLPLYPQYAASSSASALDAVLATLQQRRNMPDLRTVRHFYNHPDYIAALAHSVRSYWLQNGRPDKLVLSFHGIPRFSVDKGDPYPYQCQETARLLAAALGLSADDFSVVFQSRFGRAEWLTPYASETFKQLGKAKTRRIDVICPGFVADCLETLEEIAIEGKETFLTAGGGEFHYIACLNESPQWISALASLVEKHLAGWVNPFTQREQERQALGES